jgi:hypothetical protein
MHAAVPAGPTMRIRFLQVRGWLTVNGFLFGFVDLAIVCAATQWTMR